MSRRAPASHTRLLTVMGGGGNHSKKAKFKCHHLQGAAPASWYRWDQAGLVSSSLFVSTGAAGDSKSSSKVAFQQPFGNFTLTQKALVTLRKN